jgi:hypothetical protein
MAFAPRAGQVGLALTFAEPLPVGVAIVPDTGGAGHALFIVRVLPVGL